MWSTILDFLPKLFSGIGVFIGFMIAAFIVKRIVDVFLSMVPQIQKVCSNTVRTIIMLVGMLVSLGTMGVDLGAMWTSLGITGFAVGFALKDTISNALSGIIILIYQPFKIGDKITIKGEAGKVVLIDLRYTTMAALEGNDVTLVPNSQLLSNILKVANGREDVELKIQEIEKQIGVKNEISSIG